jgi:hypothetical protein
MGKLEKIAEASSLGELAKNQAGIALFALPQGKNTKSYIV